MNEEKTLESAVLVYLVRNGDILLAIKKEKIGAGCWNGYGGGLQEGESFIEAAIRETQEESGGVKILPGSLIKVAILAFANTKADGSNFTCAVHVYFAYAWEGAPKPTKEMDKPTWFNKKHLPLEKMMLADQVWLPIVLGGKKITAKATYGPFQQYLFEPVIYEIVESFPSE